MEVPCARIGRFYSLKASCHRGAGHSRVWPDADLDREFGYRRLLASVYQFPLISVLGALPMFAIPHFHLSKSAVLGLSVLAAIAAFPAAQAQITYDAQIPFSFSSPTLVSPRGIAVAPD